MDPRIQIILAFLFVTWTTNYFLQFVAKNGKAVKELDGTKGCLVAIAALVSLPVIFISGAWADMIVWNMLAPQFSFPQIDLITALGVSLLLQSLIKGTTPMSVRIVKPDLEA